MSARGLSIRALLLGAHAFVLVLPLAALFMLRVYDVYLLRQTERQLIAESVLVGEMFRDAYERAGGARVGALSSSPRKVTHGRQAEAWGASEVPIEAQIGFREPVLARDGRVLPTLAPSGSPAAEAGKSIEPALRRAQAHNLSGIRVLDERGCVVSTTRGEEGRCMGGLPEVARALSGHYEAVLRARGDSASLPGLSGPPRRGSVRVFTALPIRHAGRVIGVVRASRTGLDALSSLWLNRRGLLAGALLALSLVLGVSVFSSAAIVRPIARLGLRASRVAQGADVSELALPGVLPTEIQLLRDALVQMATKLAARADYVREFASQVSHELKTPITAIRGAAELLQQSADMDEPDRRRFTDNIVEDAHRMERLVRRLLELAHRENEGLVKAPEVDPVAQVLALLDRYGERVICEVLDPPRKLRLDPEQLECVLVNLVDNALRHGAPHPVTVTLDGEQGRLRIDVHDRGPGVSEPNRKRLFERFFTTERERGGTGLGLAIVRAIAEGRGGRVAAHFSEGKSTFSVVL